jgi:hypothetical protein
MNEKELRQVAVQEGVPSMFANIAVNRAFEQAEAAGL